MPKHTLLSEPDHVDEPQQVQDYWGLVSRVAATQHPVIVRRGGARTWSRCHPGGIPGRALRFAGAAGGRAARGPGLLGAGGPCSPPFPAVV